jgi:hypothetical protein
VARRSKFKDLQNQIRGSRIPLLLVSQVRGKLSLSDTRALAAWLPNVRHNGRPPFQGQYPAHIAELRKQFVFASVPIDREIVWAGELLRQHTSRLKTFLPLAREYENDLVCGHYAHCLALLDTIEAQLGISLWTIENRIGLLQLAEGLEKQKGYASSVREARAEHDLVSFIAFNVSHRNEDSATPGRFTANLAERFDNWNTSLDLRAYLLFRLGNQHPEDEKGFAAILRYEASSAIIDYYDTFVRLAQLAVLSGTESVQRCFIEELRRLMLVLDDSRISKMIFLQDIPRDGHSSLFARDVTADDALAEGRYEDAVVLARRSRTTEPVNSTNLIVEALARTEIGDPVDPNETTLAARIINLAVSIIGKTDDINDAVIGLIKTCLNFRLMSFSAGLEAFLWQELSTEPLPYNTASSNRFS